ncbi:hypothetical protein [Streptomyces sp. AK02-04a]|uniref:hypothetical protein n=1 Tax=Streptomyces sp. AK02-04a TaxID=3028649 RepID=UPI0029A5E372|nr:hypothetical protein [Streptomyces sp. AK02-04a]MDX3762618.1 hypothetical protein [Streptomyces sp. AK02-04a]
MSTALVPPETATARKRRRKARTKKVSSLPAIVASELPHAEIDLTPGREHLVCPTCKRWTPITGVLGTPKLVPHHTEPARAHTETPHRCTGTNRKVDINIAIEDWHTEWTEAVATAAARRATKVLRKPKVIQAPAVSQITPAPLSATSALDAYREHFKKCRKSEGIDHCGGTRRCADGARLAALYEQLQPSDSVHDRVRTREARVDTLLARVRATTASRTAASEWTKHREATTAPRTALAKRSGTAVEEANNTHRIPLPGTVSHLRGIEVPLKPLRPQSSAH